MRVRWCHVSADEVLMKYAEVASKNIVLRYIWSGFDQGNKMSEQGPQQQRPDLMGGRDERADVLAGGEVPSGEPDVMGGPQPPSDVIAGGREPADEDSDVMRGGREPSGTGPDIMAPPGE
jgi:hypothetical protein